VAITDESDLVCGLALQGPTSFSVLDAAGLGGVASLKPYDFMEFDGGDLLISRTGYTGDLGYELWTTPDRALALWDRLWQAGEQWGIRAIGTDALNMVRLEAGFIMTGTEYASTHNVIRRHRGRTPFELGLGRMVHFDKNNFNGRRALLAHAENGPRYMLVGLDIGGNIAAKDAYVYHRKKKIAGQVNSALWSPTCKQNLAYAMLKAPYGIDIVDNLWVEIYTMRELQWQRLMMRAKIIKPPFLKLSRRSATPPGRF
jgi:aminomethyltransferase